jgi:mono/diheme cytochrome c family protein
MLKAESLAGSTHPAAPPAGPTAAYGRYLANVGGCTGCHGAGLSGGKIPGTPAEFKPPANITPAGIGHWTEADFVRALRTGVRPGGTNIDPEMPWRLTRLMTDEEIHALYEYLKTVPAKPYGNR